MKIIKIASPESDVRDLKKDVNSQDKDIKDLKKEIKDLDKEIKKLAKDIKDLNIGDRRYWQQQSSFTSLQRKIERFEVVEQEWKKYKLELDAPIRDEIEKKHRAQIK